MIEAGEYVRTKRGKIRKVKDTVAQYYITDRLNITDNNQFVEEDIVKHSKNIIDLIEPGDIVNGHCVRKVYLDGAVKYMKLDNSHSVENNFSGVRTYEDDIKTILTKEQMEANQYVIKRNMETN